MEERKFNELNDEALDAVTGGSQQEWRIPVLCTGCGKRYTSCGLGTIR